MKSLNIATTVTLRIKSKKEKKKCLFPLINGKQTYFSPCSISTYRTYSDEVIQKALDQVYFTHHKNFWENNLKKLSVEEYKEVRQLYLCPDYEREIYSAISDVLENYSDNNIIVKTSKTANALFVTRENVIIV